MNIRDYEKNNFWINILDFQKKSSNPCTKDPKI